MIVGGEYEFTQRKPMALSCGVSAAHLKKYFNDQEVVELTVTSAFYGAVAQITRALNVKLEPNAGQTAYGAC